MQITEELDSGPVMKKIKIKISPSDIKQLKFHKIYQKLGLIHIVEALDNIFDK